MSGESYSLDRPGNNVEHLRFVERVFSTFAWRPAPTDIWARDHWDYDYYKDGFDPVPPREFDIEVFQSHPFHSQGDRLCVMTPQGFLYYLPAFIVLLLENIGHTNDLGDVLLHTLRSVPPYVGPIARWVVRAREQPSLDDSPIEFGKPRIRFYVARLEDWFVRKASLCQCEHIANMTEPEREIVVQFLDRFVEDPEFAFIANEIHSIQSIIRNDSYCSRLGAMDEVDVLDLLRLLDIATNKYPSRFPSHLYESIRCKIERSVID